MGWFSSSDRQLEGKYVEAVRNAQQFYGTDDPDVDQVYNMSQYGSFKMTHAEFNAHRHNQGHLDYQTSIPIFRITDRPDYCAECGGVCLGDH